MTTFTEITRRIGHTDKAGTRVDGHTYSTLYDQWFAPYRDRPVEVLEVGVAAFGGGCLLALAAYFPKGRVTGVDIDLGPLVAEVRNHPRVHLIEADAYDPAWLNQLDRPAYDLVIDDASHEIADQVKLLRMLRPYLSRGGFYVVEDVVSEHWLPHLRTLPDELDLWHTLCDMATRSRYDNTLLRFDTR